MAGKLTGLGATVTIDDSGGTGRDISNDIHSFRFGTPRATQDVTGVDKSAMERLLLLADFSCELDGLFNVDANKSHDVFKTVPSSTATRTVVIAFGATMTAECVFTDYAHERSDAGEHTWTAPGVLANGTAPAWS